MKSNYNEWLLVSDIDGTLNDKKFKLPHCNKKAINHFVDNGGYFTLCSGRNLQSLLPHYEKLNIKTPAIFLNGAGIYDFNTGEVIDYNPITPKGEDIILEIFSRYKTVELTVYDANMIYLYKRNCLYGYIVSRFNNLNFKRCKNENDLPRGIWGKVTFFGFRKHLNEIKSFLETSEMKSLFYCFFTSPFSLEVVKAGVNKGSAVNRLTDILSVNHQNVGAIGDYYNDVEMLKAVSHPVCCGQAPDDIKSLCEHVACHCNDGAVCDFINYIEKNYIL